MCGFVTTKSGRVLDVSRCDSSGERAFPFANVCKCSMGGDKNGDLRFWGNAAGKKRYNPATGFVEKGPKLAWYNIVGMEKKLSKMSLDEYESKMQSGDLPCHSKPSFYKANIIVLYCPHSILFHCFLEPWKLSKIETAGFFNFQSSK